MSDTELLASQVDAWLQPVAGADRPSGRPVPDDTFREFKSALAGKPDTQFSEEVPPDFRKVVALAEEIFVRSRDLTVAVGWCRAMLRTQGITVLPQGLRLLRGLLETFREDLHPQADPEDGSCYARANAISVLSETSGMLGDLRQAILLSDRVHGEVRTRTIEIALGKLSPREGEALLTPDQLRRFFASSTGAPALRDLLVDARACTKALSATINEQMDALDAPDLSPLLVMLDTILSMIPQPASAKEPDAQSREPQPAAGGARASPGVAGEAITGNIYSRADVVRAIDMACEYLERAEPTNPAQLLMRRAKQLLDQNFLQLIQDLAPNSLADVARVMGVDAAKLTSASDVPSDSA